MSSVQNRQSSVPAIPGQKGGPRFWRGSFALMSAMVFWFAAAHAQSGAAKDAPDKVLGTWLTDSGNLEIEIARCGEALCGKVTKVLANRSMSGSGEMVSADKRDPLGMTILKDFKPSGEGEWSGEIYNRENAKTYSCKIIARRTGPIGAAPLCRAAAVRQDGDLDAGRRGADRAEVIACSISCSLSPPACSRWPRLACCRCCRSFSGFRSASAIRRGRCSSRWDLPRPSP